MKLLLHVCCAPCVLPIIEKIKNESDLEISLYFFNPNIYPDEEYEKRLEAVDKIAEIYKLPLYIENPGFLIWNKEISEKLSEPPEMYSENGKRCDVCISYRLKNTALFAKRHDFDEFATTLSVSLWKNTELLKQYGNLLAEENKLIFRDFSEINPEEAHKTEKVLSEKYGIYRQKYCGCKYSIYKK